jgi:hypothetical protein
MANETPVFVARDPAVIMAESKATLEAMLGRALQPAQVDDVKVNEPAENMVVGDGELIYQLRICRKTADVKTDFLFCLAGGFDITFRFYLYQGFQSFPFSFRCNQGKVANDQTPKRTSHTIFPGKIALFRRAERSRTACRRQRIRGVPRRIPGIPRKSRGVPGKIPGVPGKSRGVPGKIRSVPGKSRGTP